MIYHHHHHRHLQPNGIGHLGWFRPQECWSLHLLLGRSIFLLRAGMCFYTFQLSEEVYYFVYRSFQLRL
jgi:hypothetical protein